MAKHRIDSKGTVSKGLRVSSYSMKRKPAKAVQEFGKQVNSTMRQAFDDIKLKNISASARAITKTVLSGLDRKVGLVSLGQGWNASLTDKTAKLLNAGEWDNPQARNQKGVRSMAYDRMVSA